MLDRRVCRRSSCRRRRSAVAPTFAPSDASATAASTLDAKDATVRQILAEWARVGQTKIVNVERVPGGPMTLELDERARGAGARNAAALASAATRRAAADRRSPTRRRFDRILVMPTSTRRRAPRAAPRACRRTSSNRSSPRGRSSQSTTTIDDDPAPVAPNAVPNPRGPIFNTFPQPHGATAPNACRTAAGDPPVPQGFPMPQQQARRHSRTAPPRRRAAGRVSTPGMVGAGAAQPVSRASFVPPAIPAAADALARPRLADAMALVDDVTAAIADAMRQQGRRLA